MPAEKLVAVANAPPTVDAMLEAAYQAPASTSVHRRARRRSVRGHRQGWSGFLRGSVPRGAGTTTDIVAYAGDGVFVQMWIGAQDKLPRMARAVFRNDPLRLRHQVEFSSWKLDGAVPAGAFASSRAAAAKRIPFAHPDPGPPMMGTPPPVSLKSWQQ
jgi:hypothetical protein